jgi:hypothetical protein
VDTVVDIAPWMDAVLFEQSLGICAIILLQSAIEGQACVTRRKYNNILRFLCLEDVIKYGEGRQTRTDMRLFVSERNIQNSLFHLKFKLLIFLCLYASWDQMGL